METLCAKLNLGRYLAVITFPRRHVSYADDDAPYEYAKNYNKATMCLSNVTATKYFLDSKWKQILENSIKILFNSYYETIHPFPLNSTVEFSSSVEVLGITDKCTFYEHINTLYTNANLKISAPAHVLKHLNMVKEKYLLAMTLHCILTLSWWRSPSYRNQSTDLPTN